MRRVLIIALGMTLNVLPSTALAVHVATNPDDQKPVFQWIFALVMVGLICVVAFKNPKRSHQG